MTPGNPSNAVLLERITNIQGDVSEIKATLKEVAECSPRITSAEATLEDHTKQLTEINKVFPSIKFGYKILAWASGIFGLAILSLVWAILTHTVLLVKP